jgi:hypothetical protein
LRVLRGDIGFNQVEGREGFEEVRGNGAVLVEHYFDYKQGFKRVVLNFYNRRVREEKEKKEKLQEL